MLGHTKAAKIGFSSKSGQGYIDSMKKIRHMIQRMQTLLDDGRGAAFHASPAQGVIQPWGEYEVKVTSYNNLVGLYEDFMVCEVGDWVKTRMPVRLGVVGTPIKFSGPQLVAKKKADSKEVDKVNFGARVINPRWGGGDGVRVGLDPEQDSHFGLNRQVNNNGSFSNITHKNLPEAFKKTILIENQSPRDVILRWKVYIRHSSDDQIDDIGTHNVDDIIRNEYLVNDGEIGIITVSQPSLTISAFKTSTLTCIYRSAMLGNFDALIMADVGYIESDGSTRFAPRKKPKVVSDKDHPNKSPKVLIQQLDSIAKIHVQAKCIEPKLSLDSSNRIRIKHTIRPFVSEQQNAGRSVIAFLKNNSDAVCSFTLEAIPTSIFTVIGSSKYIKKEDDSPAGTQATKKTVHKSDLTVYELKQTEQLLTTVRYQRPHMPSRPDTSHSNAQFINNLPDNQAKRSARFSHEDDKLAQDDTSHFESLLNHIQLSNTFVSEKTPSVISSSVDHKQEMHYDNNNVRSDILSGSVSIAVTRPHTGNGSVSVLTTTTEIANVDIPTIEIEGSSNIVVDEPINSVQIEQNIVPETALPAPVIVETKSEIDSALVTETTIGETRKQMFRTIASGELRITFSNGMAQSIPIVVEEPC